ncbi:MAG: apolipoprotein N-acyltransferase [Deltaproteobacteria bacterium]|nr:apolipoprotein N-acyltransferase [Deltaproteobacteria bacterium]
MKKRILCSIISGILLILSFPPFGLGFLAWFALVPLMFAAAGQRARDGFFTGLLAGFVFYVGTVYWVVNSMYFYGGVPVWISVPVMLLLAAYMALYFGAFCVFFSQTGRVGGFAALAFSPAVWVALEYLRAHLLTGFPWILLGYSQTPYLPVIQIADITGVYGISFVIVIVNAAVFLYVKSVMAKEPYRPVREAVVALGILISVFSYGLMRMKQVDADALSWRGINVAAAQGNIDQSVKWDPARQKETTEIYRGLTKEASALGASLIVWPETAAPFFLGEDSPQTEFVRGVARETNSYILAGTLRSDYSMERHGLEYFNSAVLITPGGEFKGRYDKTHLVPFGEYVPLKRFLPFVKKLTAGVGDFSEGPGPVPIKFNGEGIGILICYEAIFPEISRGAVKNGATLLANITNDAWFGRSSAPYQHFDMTVMRSVENRIYTVRSANTGISGFIDPVGRVVKKSGLFQRETLGAEVRLRRGGYTFYTVNGDIFAYGCLALSGLFVLSRLLRRRR